MGSSKQSLPAFTRKPEDRQKYVQDLVKQCLSADPSSGSTKASDEDLDTIRQRTERKSLRKDQLNKESNVTAVTTGSSGGGSGSDSEQGASKKLSPRAITILALVFGFVVITLQLIYWSHRTDVDHVYNNSDAGKVEVAGLHEVATIKARADLVRAQAELAQATGVIPAQAASVLRQSASVGTLEVRDGDQFVIPENTKTIVREGATIVIVDTASRIKSFSGDFTVERLGAGEAASVPSAEYFERLPKWPTQTKVRIHVNKGTAELGT